MTVPRSAYLVRSSLSELLKQHRPLSLVKQVHARAVVHSLYSHGPLRSALIHRYLSCHDLRSATILFDDGYLSSSASSSPPAILWNLMIRAHSKTPNSLEPFKYFSRMLAVPVGGSSSSSSSMVSRPDDYTYTFVVTSCSHQVSWVYGEIVHGLIVKGGFESDLFVGNSLIHMYSVYGQLVSAQKVFDQMAVWDVFSWTSLLGGFAKNGKIDRAREIFLRMPWKNDVSWAVIISGFVSCEMYVEALNYFRSMLSDAKMKPNEAVLVCALSACAHLGALDLGQWILDYVDNSQFVKSSSICTALIDMYAKCGRIDHARRIFNDTSTKDVHNFTSMISGLSIHGLGNDSVDLFYDMLEENVKPNEITLLGVLKGCNHSGLVQEGTTIFNNMASSWGIAPKVEHYGCYVDLLGRAGQVERAFEVVKSMPIEPDIAIWRSLLSGCRIHRNISLAEHIISHVRQLESSSHKNGNVLLSNLYAYMGRWEDVVEVRRLMGNKRNTLDPGCSWIEINGVVHEFRVDDQLHPQILEIRKKLNEILEKATLGGYVMSTTQVTFDLSEDDKQQAIALHSEKLAIAFGLMSTPEGALIRIVKNLRTCEDCHAALKAISIIYDREIIVRDRSRFHTFKAGKCSCNDYW